MSHFSAVTNAYVGSWARRNMFVPIYVAVRLLVIALIAPIMAFAVNFAVSLSNQSALTDQDIAMFILSPAGFVVAVVMLSLFLLAEVLVFAVMAGSLRVGEQDPWRAGSSAIGLILNNLSSLMSFAVRLVLRVLVLILPFAAVAAVIAWWTLTEYDINYYLTFHPPSFWLAVILIGLIALALAWVLIHRLSDWALSLHLVLFEGLAPAKVFGESVRRMEDKRVRLQIQLALWVLLRLAIATVLGGIASLLFDLVPLKEGVNLRLALTLSLTVAALWSLAGLVLAATALGALAVLLDGFFEPKSAEQSHPQPRNLRPRLFA
ncbi:MAG: glycerophosphodiester phosphodiesterase, partial [Ruegeria sp.]